MAREFGASDAQAQLAAVGTIIGGSSAARTEYRPSSDCRPGGRYDPSPGAAAWPSR